MENRLRDKQINIRATEFEYQLIKERMKKSGTSSLQKYMIDAAINSYLVHVDYTEVKALAYEINRVGNNINQIAHKINTEGNIFKKEIEEVQENVELIWKMLRAKFYQIP